MVLESERFSGFVLRSGRERVVSCLALLEFVVADHRLSESFSVSRVEPDEAVIDVDSRKCQMEHDNPASCPMLPLLLSGLLSRALQCFFNLPSSLPDLTSFFCRRWLSHYSWSFPPRHGGWCRGNLRWDGMNPIIQTHGVQEESTTSNEAY